MPTVMEINISDSIHPSFSNAGTSNIINNTGDNNENINKPLIDLKIVKHQNSIYVRDDTEKKNGVNLIKQLQPQGVKNLK